MKKKTIPISIFTLCITLFTGCQETGSNAIDISAETIPDTFESVMTEGDIEGAEEPESNNSIDLQEEKTIDGYDFVDGNEMPVRIRIGIENILKGEEAYNKLCEQNADIQLPGENEEYIIVTFNISYDEGGIDELFMTENRASLEAAGLYFSLSNSGSNAYDVTSCLTNNIYNVSVLKGQSAQGAVAFLQEKDNTQPLHFIGFGYLTEFIIN